MGADVSLQGLSGISLIHLHCLAFILCSAALTHSSAIRTINQRSHPTSTHYVFPPRRLLLSEGYEPDVVFTSRLKRAVKSTWTLLNAISAPYLPVYKSWRLNERNYGGLTGLSKMAAAKVLGVDVVQAW